MPPKPPYRHIPHHTGVMKPNRKWSHAELKVYVKRWKLDKAPVPLSLSKKHMVARLKLEKHWDDEGTGRPSAVPKKVKKEKPKFQKEEEVRPTERLEGPAAGSVKARVKGTHQGVIPFVGFGGFGGGVTATAEAEGAKKQERQVEAAELAKKRRKMKAIMREKGLGSSLAGQPSMSGGQERQVKAAALAKKRRKMKALMKAKGLGSEWSGTYSSFSLAGGSGGSHQVYHPTN
jgi:hypothetical protein